MACREKNDVLASLRLSFLSCLGSSIPGCFRNTEIQLFCPSPKERLKLWATAFCWEDLSLLLRKQHKGEKVAENLGSDQCSSLYGIPGNLVLPAYLLTDSLTELFSLFYILFSFYSASQQKNWLYTIYSVRIRSGSPILKCKTISISEVSYSTQCLFFWSLFRLHHPHLRISDISLLQNRTEINPFY